MNYSGTDNVSTTRKTRSQLARYFGIARLVRIDARLDAAELQGTSLIQSQHCEMDQFRRLENKQSQEILGDCGKDFIQEQSGVPLEVKSFGCHHLSVRVVQGKSKLEGVGWCQGSPGDAGVGDAFQPFYRELEYPPWKAQWSGRRILQHIQVGQLIEEGYGQVERAGS